MIDIITLINFSIPVAGLMIVLYGLVITSVTTSDKATRRFLLLFFIVLALYLATNLASMISELYMGNTLLTQTSVFFEILFASLLMPLLALYITIRSGDTSRSAVMYIVDIIWILFFVLLGYTQMSNTVYYVSEDNVYHRGPQYPLMFVPPLLIMAVMLIALIRRRRRLTRKQFIAFITYIAIPVIAIGLQIYKDDIHYVVLGTTVASGVLMAMLLTDQADQAAKQQQKLYDQEASLRVLQMRPHFIYNTLMSIYYLCVDDPERAQKVILDFSTYLRKNFTSIANEKPIPFTEELEHARAYLAVEQVRFEGELFVEYDTPYTDFNLPPLTLQPLAENSVKHGVDPERDPLHVYISTKKTATGYDVIVADTGPGFGSAVINNVSGNRVALSNIRNRLAAVGGDLTISDREGGGSVVTLHIRA